MNPLFRPKTIKTILESAPLVIQGAGRLIQLIRERDADKNESRQPGPSVAHADDAPDTLEQLRVDLGQLEDRLKANSAADVEQIRLIEELAKQNEALAQSVTKNYSRITILTIIAGLALVVALLAVVLAAN